MIMMRIKTYIPGSLLLLATLAATPMQADDYISCKEYYTHSETSVRGGTIEAAQDGNTWILTATPANSKWMFVQWSDGNTDNPRTIVDTLMSDLTETFTAEFAVWVYTNCYAPNEFTMDPEYAIVEDTSRIEVDTISENEFQLRAVAEDGFTFVQWADGSYENPRTFVPSTSSKDTIYATFIPDSTAGLIDSWAKDGFVIKTTSDEGDLRALGPVLVYYDNQLMTSDLPVRKDWGVYKVSATYASENAGKQCHIVYKHSADTCVPVATLDVTIPVLIDGEDDGSSVVVPNSSTGVHVLKDGVATLTGTQTIADLDVYAGGQAVVEGTVTASSVTLRGDAPNNYNPGSLLVQGTLNNLNSDTIYYDYALDYYAYYPFALPYTVNTEKVTYRSGANADEHYILGRHDGDARANGRPNTETWPDYYDYASTSTHVDIEAGTGYNIFAESESWYHKERARWYTQESWYWANIRFPMKASIPTGGVTSASIPVYEYPSETKSNRNWNFLGSPYLSAYDGPLALYNGDDYVQDVNYVTIPVANCSDFDQPRVGDVPLQPFWSFFIQFDNDITVDNLRFESPDPSVRSAAPARRLAKAANSNDEIKAGITLSQNNKKDHTALLIGDEYTVDYDFNADLGKMIGTSPKRAKVFSLQGDKKLAYMAIPPAEGTGSVETVIPLGYSNAKTGAEMTFALDDDWYPQLRDNEKVTELNLIDNVEGTTTNLLEDSYTCTAAKASDNTRFSLGIRYTYKAPQIATDICETPAETTMHDGVYDLLGRLISTDARAARAGVYIVIENGKARKEVVR